VLIVYEADWERSEEGLKELEARWDNEDQEDHNEENGSDYIDDDDDDDDDSDEDDTKGPGPPYVVKLIDFAHTHIKPGQGPDQGVLLGLDTLFRLLNGRIEQVRNAMTQN